MDLQKGNDAPLIRNLKILITIFPSKIESGNLQFTNITTSAPAPGQKEKVIKTVILGQGEPGYFLTAGKSDGAALQSLSLTASIAVMTSEIALSLLPDSFSRLTELGKKGGVLTSMSAVGPELIERLKKTGRFQFESGPLGEVESKKEQ